MEKEPLRFVLPYLGTISMQTMTKFQNSIEGGLNCCKLEVNQKTK